MKQIFYVLSDLKLHKRVNIFFILQMIIVILLTTFSVTLALSTYKGYNALSKIANNNTYVLSDNTDPDHLAYLFANEDKYTDDIRKLYSDIISSQDYYTYTAYSYIDIEQKDGISIKQYTSDLNFLEINGIEVSQGRMLRLEDYELSDINTIPILVGYKLKDMYKLGNIYTLYDGGTGAEISCQVVGILKNNAGYYNLESIDQYINLNYSYIKPLMYMNVNSMSYSDIDMAIASTVFFAEDSENIEAVVEEAYKLGLFSYSVDSLKSELDDFVDTMKESLEFILGIAIIIFLFASVGMTANLNMMIRQNMKEYTIHILCGGRYKDIATRLSLQLSISIIISIIPSLICFGVNMETFYSILLIIVVMSGVLIIPLKKLYSTPISELLRRNE